MSKGPGGQYILPPLAFRESPNQSKRLKSRVPWLIVLHDTEGGYAGAVKWLCNPDADASAHVVLREDGNHATQLVPWFTKAWACCGFNDCSLNIELAGFLNQEGTDQWHSAARITSYFCTRYHIPPYWSRNGQHPGVTRHKDLGAIGCGHIDPTTDENLWMRFIFMVKHEFERGGFLPSWGQE